MAMPVSLQASEPVLQHPTMLLGPAVLLLAGKAPAWPSPPLVRCKRCLHTLWPHSKPELAANPPRETVWGHAASAGSCGLGIAACSPYGRVFNSSGQRVCPRSVSRCKCSLITISMAVFIRLLLQLSVSRSFYPAQRAGAHSCFCHLISLIQQCFNP